MCLTEGDNITSHWPLDTEHNQQTLQDFILVVVATWNITVFLALTMSGIEAVSVLKLTSNWCTRVSRVSSVSGVFGQELV